MFVRFYIALMSVECPSAIEGIFSERWGRSRIQFQVVCLSWLVIFFKVLHFAGVMFSLTGGLGLFFPGADLPTEGLKALLQHALPGGSWGIAFESVPALPQRSHAGTPVGLRS